jgi:hypothetical protein
MTDNSKITGFDTLSTLRFEGFTERNMSELEQILLNLDKSESIQNIKDFYINLYNHIHSTRGHDIDLSGYSDAFYINCMKYIDVMVIKIVYQKCYYKLRRMLP